MVIRESFPVGPLGCNFTLIACDRTFEAIVIDPGGDAKKILEIAKSLGVQVKRILHTHAHFDHLGATKAIHDATKAIRYLHESDLFLYNNVSMQSKMFGMHIDEPGKVEEKLTDGLKIQTGDVECETLHTPGHTPGSCCFHFSSISFLASGDTLFNGGVGRTDLWGGNFDEMKASIQNKIYKLPAETIVMPGHGEETTIGTERQNNPFVRGS